jgi:hypothetical protein
VIPPLKLRAQRVRGARQAFILATVLIALSAGACANALANGGSSILDRHGRLVTVAPRYAAFLRQAGFLHVYLLGTRNEHDYYRLTKPNRYCYGVGATPLHRPSQIKCFMKDPAVFIDFSVVESSRGNPQIHLWRLEGMAHDSVAAVGMIGKSGQLLAKVPLHEGIYYLKSPPPDPISKIAYFDAHGHILATRIQ